MVIALVAGQQVQVRLGGAGNHFGSVQDQLFGLLRIHHHQGVANGVHECVPVRKYSFVWGGWHRCLWPTLARPPTASSLTDITHATANIELRPLSSIVNP
ncbi:hypothetical protein D3C73_1341200 [compost metagenome]